MTTVAEALAERLHSAGVRVVFGLPGGETAEMLDAIRRQGLRFVLVRSESAAAFMADAHARLTGIPGICLATLGPGATNAVTGVAHAFLDRSPVIVITAQKPQNLLPNYTHQVLDLHQLFKTITKASVRVTAANVYESVDSALALVQRGRPGPVHLQLSNEEAALCIAEPAPSKASGNVAVEQPALEQVRIARNILRRAKRPLVLAGLGLEPERPYVALRRFAEKSRAPVLVTPKAKGCLADEHPLVAGTIGLTRSDPVYELLGEADCIIAIGFDVVELVRPWEHLAPLIWIASWANHDPVLPAAVELIGTIGPILDQLAASDNVASDWGAERVLQFHNSPHGALLPEPAPGRLQPQAILNTLHSCWPAEAVLTVDVGSHKIFSSLAWQALAPNRFLLSNGLSSMGYALPAAIGASIALPSYPIVCLTGDAGLAMTLGDLGVLAELGGHVVVIVLSDGAIDLIRSHQVRAGKAIFGTEFSPPHFAKIAEAHGISSRRVGTENEFLETLNEALNVQRPFLIEVMLDPRSYPTTPSRLA